ncbi:veratrol--corrinoid protein metyltransferase, partial [Blautia hominis]|nr:veratrol--corrinoid protein metyltransferase [Blautia hominis]
NAWDPAQTCNDLTGIKEKYGNKLVIMGGFDPCDHLADPNVTEEEIRQAVRDTMDRLAPGSGFCWCGGYLGAIDDPEVIRKNGILFDEVFRYGDAFYKK